MESGGGWSAGWEVLVVGGMMAGRVWAVNDYVCDPRAGDVVMRLPRAVPQQHDVYCDISGWLKGLLRIPAGTRDLKLVGCSYDGVLQPGCNIQFDVLLPIA